MIMELVRDIQRRDLKVSLDANGDLKLQGELKNADSEFLSRLKESKSVLVDWLRQHSQNHVQIGKADRTKPLLASFAQQRLWLAQQIDESSARNHVVLTTQIDNGVDKNAFKQALAHIVQRHEVLRTTFVASSVGVEQCIQQSVQIPTHFEVINYISHAKLHEQIQSKLQLENQESFDLEEGPLMRVCVLECANDQEKKLTVVNFCFHHIVTDAVSTDIFLTEFMHCYTKFLQGSEPNLPELQIQYADFAQWQQEIENRGGFERQKAFWREQLKDAPHVHCLPLDGLRKAQSANRAGEVRLLLGSEDTEALKAFAKKRGVTLFMLLHAALGLVISKHSQHDTVVIGSPVANRTNAETTGLMGFFVNNLVLRTSTSHDTVEQYLSHVQSVNQLSQSNQELPFELVLEAAGASRSNLYNPLFQIMLNLKNEDEEFVEVLEGTRGYSSKSEQIKFDIDINFRNYDNELELIWAYNTDLFGTHRMEVMAQQTMDSLRQFTRIENLNDVAVSELLAATSDEIDHLMALSNSRHKSNSERPRTEFIHELFNAQAKCNPKRAAIVDVQGTISYQLLNERSNQLANYLIKNGVQKHARVGILLTRQAEFFVTLLGILKAGAVYVPFDPEHPVQRLSYMLEDCAPQVLITCEGEAKHIAELQSQCQIIQIDSNQVRQDIADCEIDSVNVAFQLSANDPAYIIYTSGSTGQPKGTVISHRSVSWFAHWQQQAFDVSSDSKVLQYFPYCFDASVWEWCMALCSGASLHLCTKEERLCSETLQNKMIDEQITHATCTPNVFKFISSKEAYTLKYLFIGGEAVPQALCNEWSEKYQFVNCYGPTETTVISSYSILSPNEPVNIGKPTLGAHHFVLNENKEMVPFGAVGELYIGGEQLAIEYLNQPELTAERFSMVTLSDGVKRRLYRTGDIVRFNHNEKLEFLGRVDKQVKVRGNRIELEEIKFHINVSDAISACEVLVINSASVHPVIAAFLVPHSSACADDEKARHEKEIITRLRAALPSYMQVQSFVWLEHLPFTVNDKIDTEKLTELFCTEVGNKERKVPSFDLEEAVFKQWETHIPAERIGVDDNFFALGGHSILAVRILSELNSSFNVKLELKDLFENATIEELTLVLAEKIAMQQQTEEAFEAFFMSLPNDIAQQVLSKLVEH
ncbi:hypothetical protein BET10_05580 [Pseudoalteromonas amylolytica]|uniref:Carrier domain-containing protein n=2 Tax=Pseudoalteromonas TaxID=53246 RepID=A0A1S1MZ73_9GAMM|nr:hypothetical protein BFC16_04640 [Pseudoalteromonas sp. JW3]OHU92394.1 hypothetical protein BET10_05580 [Pseudoalteromonas amylolytica]